MFKILEKLQDAGYRVSEKNSEVSLEETIWLGHEKTTIKKTERKKKIGATLR